MHIIETRQNRVIISKQFLTSGAEILSQLGGVLLYGRAEAEIPLLTNTNKDFNKVKFQK